MRADDPRHGTNAGYQAHQRAHEPACSPCVEAKRLDSVARYIGRKQRSTGACMDCGISIHGRAKRCIECHTISNASTKYRRCEWCGKTTTSLDGTCQDCARLRAVPEPTKSEALPPGRWINRGGVLRYLTVKEETAAYAAATGQKVACGYCYALDGEPCTNADGEPVFHHSDRIKAMPAPRREMGRVA
jgi:hypothetical protein